MNRHTAPAASVSSDDDFHRPDESLFRFLVDSLTEYAVFAVSPDGIVISWNSGAEKIFGFSKSEIIGRSFDAIFTPEDVKVGAPGTELASAVNGENAHFDRWHVRKDGSRFWGTNTVQPLYDKGGRLLAFTKLVRDTTATHLAIEQLSDSEQQLRLLVESVRDFAIFSIDIDGTIKTWNAGAQRVFGYLSPEIIGQNVSLLLSSGQPDIMELANLASHKSVTLECWLVRKNVSKFIASGTIDKLAIDAAGERRGFVLVIHDKTESHAAVEALRRQAQLDALTNLPNRRIFFDHLERCISTIKRRPATSFAVLFLDLDHFKAVNDKFGHVAADEVIISIARRLEACVRAEDVVARVGGDEFAILLTGINGVTHADDAAQRILASMREAVATAAGDVFTCASIGIAIGTAKYNRPEELMRDADAAMYVAKRQGRARAVVFDDLIRHVTRNTTDLTAALRYAIERDELRIMYQPILRLIDMSVAGFEALVRWAHPRRGLLLPSEFIPLAEGSSLVIAIDRWVMLQACRQLADWKSRGLFTGNVQMSVNVSSIEFSHDGFLSVLQDVLESSALQATDLRLEITEGTILERSPRAYAMLSSVRALGIRVDVDDFGTGYASLGALNDIVVDGLKIDWSFVTSKNALHGWDIVETVISLAHKLGLVAIAEGIETESQRRRLVTLGCDFGQGYLFSPALGPEAATAFLTR